MNNNIILVGFMGTGKDTVGKQIAERTGMAFFSTDRYVEIMEGMSIKAIFQKKGERYFRKKEKETLDRIKGIRNVVIATGGGIVLRKRNYEILSQMGKVVHLYAKSSVIEKRLAKNRSRPLLNNTEDLKKLYKKRIGLYKGEITIDTSNKTPLEVASIIINKAGLKKKQTDMAQEKVLVHSHSGRYPVYIGIDLKKDGKPFMHFKGRKAVVITNSLVGTLYLDKLMNTLKDAGLVPYPFFVPDGEKYKNLDQVIRIYDYLARKHIARSDVIIGFGGGVIGDLTGFVASTYKRGMKLIQIPTTLLAQVDASVGGKTGVNHRWGKNMIGSFYQPDSVISDIGFLLSLPENEFKNGLAEVIKYSIIKDKELFFLLEQGKKKILNYDLLLLKSIIKRCIIIKGEIIKKDEYEQSKKREILNFGHTIGHCIETISKYSQYKHGEAVAIGMIAESKIAQKTGFLRKDTLKKIVKLITSYGLSAEIPADMERKKLKRALMQDKKIKNGKLVIPVPLGIGSQKIKEIACKKFLLYMDQI